MRLVYADTAYWIAIVHKGDQLRDKAIQVSQQLGEYKIYTSEGIFIEMLNFFAERGEQARRVAVDMVDRIRRDPNIIVINQSSIAFDTAFKLYRDRPDKGYSLTDCESMNNMREHHLTEVLTSDTHFAQEGFSLLL